MILTIENTEGGARVHHDILAAICGDTKDKSLLDLMACNAPVTRTLGFKSCVYVDVQPWDNYRNGECFIQADVFAFLETVKNIFDVATCLDGIEHLVEGEGRLMLLMMAKRAKKVVIFTPLGDLLGLAGLHNDNPDDHRSAWYPEMLPGYACVVLPQFHKAWNGGAFYAWKCDDIEKDFERVRNILNQKIWIK